jgi:uncharacterized protein (DUF983 family)
MGNNKPCPKCGSQMHYHEDDQKVVIITIIAMVVVALAMTAVSGNW